MIYTKPVIIAILLIAFTAVDVNAQIQTTKPIRELSPESTALTRGSKIMKESG